MRVVCCKKESGILRVSMPPGKSWIFSEKFQDLESPGKYP